MKLVIVNNQVSFEGKLKEQNKIEKALKLLAEEMCENNPCYFDNSEEDNDYFDLGFAYDQRDYTTAEIRYMWKKVKKENF
jgi:hypothetical protein